MNPIGIAVSRPALHPTDLCSRPNLYSLPGSPNTLVELQSIDNCEASIRLAERSDEAPRGNSRRFTAYSLGMKASVV